MPAETISTAATNKTLGCSLAGDVSPFPAGSLTGKIALIERGICNFSEKVYNAQRGGAIAAFIYNNAANGEAIATMGAGVHAADVTIPSWHPAPQRRAEHARRTRPRIRDGAGEVRLLAARWRAEPG